MVSTQRDWGNRSNRKNAKTKYTLDRVGTDVFKAEVEKRAGVTFEASRPYEFTGRGDRIGWVEGIDGKHHLTCLSKMVVCWITRASHSKPAWPKLPKSTRGIFA